MGTEAPEKKNVAPFTASIQSPLLDPISAGTYLGGVDHPLPVQLLAEVDPHDIIRAFPIELFLILRRYDVVRRRE